MGLFGNKTKAEPVGEGSSWTAGRELSGRAITVLLIAAIICGPVALLWQVSRPESVVAAPDVVSAALPASQQAAGDYALAYVAAWLGASRDNTTELKRYVDVGSVREISETPWEYRDLAIVSLEPADDSSLVTVVIAANVKELTPDDEGGSANEWPRRYFQVVVNATAAGQLNVVGLPAPVAPQAQAKEPVVLEYATTIDNGSPVVDSVLAFLNAYLAGSGDITRVSTPGTNFVALTPAPYVLVELIDLRANLEPDETPGDGDEVRVLVTATLANVYDQRLTANYTLTLTARDDRWEISSIDLTPQEAPASAGTTPNTPTPAPAGDGN
jgi:hypothetical protein